MRVCGAISGTMGPEQEVRRVELARIPPQRANAAAAFLAVACADTSAQFAHRGTVERGAQAAAFTLHVCSRRPRDEYTGRYRAARADHGGNLRRIAAGGGKLPGTEQRAEIG